VTRIVFVRHAETDMAGTFCGHSDPELNQRGRDQLVTLIQKLKGKQFHKIFTSDLSRARQTADAIAGHFGVEVHERSGLREIYFGAWEGLRWSEVEMRHPAAAKCWITEYPNYAAPEGETLLEFQARVQEECSFLSQEAAKSPILTVTHAGFLRAAIPNFQAISEQDVLAIGKEYASIVVVEVPQLPLSRDIAVPDGVLKISFSDVL
jgi:alpha-ribazole phosphatase